MPLYCFTCVLYECYWLHCVIHLLLLSLSNVTQKFKVNLIWKTVSFMHRPIYLDLCESHSETFSCHPMCFELAVADYCQITTALKDSILCLSPFRFLFLEYAYAVMIKFFIFIISEIRLDRLFYLYIFFSCSVSVHRPMLIRMGYLQCFLSFHGCCCDKDAVKWNTLQFHKGLRHKVT
jgi:hypothetical protein